MHQNSISCKSIDTKQGLWLHYTSKGGEPLPSIFKQKGYCFSQLLKDFKQHEFSINAEGTLFMLDLRGKILRKMELSHIQAEIIPVQDEHGYFTIRLSNGKKFSKIFIKHVDELIEEWKPTLAKFSTMTKFESFFKVGEMLGFGAYGKVFQASSKSFGCKNEQKNRYAVKLYEKRIMGKKYNQNELRTMISEEIAALRLLDSKYFPKLYEVYESEEQVHLVMDLIRGSRLLPTKLEDYLPFPLKKRLRILLQILEALNILSQKGIVHRDLNPGNIMTIEDEDNKSNIKVIIIDFGLCSSLSSSDLPEQLRVCGTLRFIAPEILRSNGKCKLNNKIDMFSFGSIAYTMVTGEYLFDRSTNNKLLKENREAKIDLEKDCLKNASELEVKIIERCLKVDPQDRATAKEILQILNSADLISELEDEKTGCPWVPHHAIPDEYLGDGINFPWDIKTSGRPTTIPMINLESYNITFKNPFSTEDDA